MKHITKPTLADIEAYARVVAYATALKIGVDITDAETLPVPDVIPETSTPVKLNKRGRPKKDRDKLSAINSINDAFHFASPIRKPEFESDFKSAIVKYDTSEKYLTSTGVYNGKRIAAFGIRTGNITKRSEVEFIKADDNKLYYLPPNKIKPVIRIDKIDSETTKKLRKIYYQHYKSSGNETFKNH